MRPTLDTPTYRVSQEAVDWMLQKNGHCDISPENDITITYSPKIFVDETGAEFARITWVDTSNRVCHNFLPAEIAQRIEHHDHDTTAL